MTSGPLQRGTFLWLLAHDVRLNWRRFADMLGGARWSVLLAVFLGGSTLLHVVAWPLVPRLSGLVQGEDGPSVPLMAAVICTFSWMIAQSLFGATRTLFDRADLDLLLGSPLPPVRVFAAKAFGITASTFGSLALLMLPLANMGALLDGPAWLGIYPALLGLALIATALGLGLAIGLFFLVGPRRARIYTQLTGAFIGGAFVLGAQVLALLPQSWQPSLSASAGIAATALEPGLQSLLRLPLDCIRGDVAAMLLLLLIGGALFAAAVLGLGERFVRASLGAAGAPADAARATPQGRQIRFKAGLGRSIRRKEWRLLARDPGLFAQLSLQIIYTIPVAVVLLRNGSLPTALALAPTIVVIAAQVAASLAWIAVSAEDAPELMASAPVSPATIDRAKLTAVALPVAMILALPLTCLALVSWHAALIATGMAAAAGTSTALLNFWHPMPGSRRGMLRRHSQSKLIALVEHGLAILWAVAVVFALIGTVLTVVPVAIVAGILAFARARHRQSISLPMPKRAKAPASPLALTPATSPQ